MESGMKRLKWTSEEDEKLTRFIQENGEGTWNSASLPKQAGLLRSAKSCNSRWNNYLRDKATGGNFTKEEEDTIARMHQAIGNKWSVIAEYLPGRSNIEIKNYWSLGGTLRRESAAHLRLWSCPIHTITRRKQERHGRMNHLLAPEAMQPEKSW